MKLSREDAAKLGIPVPPPAPGSHEAIAATYSDELLDKIIDDLGKRNLRDQSNHETRWCAERSKACRAERRRRKALLYEAESAWREASDLLSKAHHAACERRKTMRSIRRK